MKTALAAGLLFACAVKLGAPYHFSEQDFIQSQIDQCIEDHLDRGPLAPDISTTCSTDSECENPAGYCVRAIASGCSDPDDYSYATECGGK